MMQNVCVWDLQAECIWNPTRPATQWVCGSVSKRTMDMRSNMVPWIMFYIFLWNHWKLRMTLVGHFKLRHLNTKCRQPVPWVRLFLLVILFQAFWNYRMFMCIYLIDFFNLSYLFSKILQQTAYLENPLILVPGSWLCDLSSLYPFGDSRTAPDLVAFIQPLINVLNRRRHTREAEKVSNMIFGVLGKTIVWQHIKKSYNQCSDSAFKFVAVSKSIVPFVCL